MYKLNHSTIIDELGERRDTYGITCGEEQIKDISTDRKKVKELVEACNRQKLSPIHFKDVVEDFLVDLQV